MRKYLSDMTAAEYRAAIAAGKLKPASEQKRKATKRKSLEQAANMDRAGGTGTLLVEVRIPFPGCGDEIHWINPGSPDLIEHWQREAEKQTGA